MAVSLRTRRERDGVWRFELEPNRSSSWPQTKRVLTAMVLLNGLIALVFAGQGLWLVAPFSGLEVAALGIGLYCCSRASYRRELIQLDGERLVVLRGGYRLESRDEFARPWVRLYWQPQANRGCGSLRLGSTGRFLEIGSFLPHAERHRLATELTRLLDRQWTTSAPQSAPDTGLNREMGL
ncbi:DUF2244 domain-containing protein [Immundisolibacter sp.]|uniref:DUF2244 domain-containing protein n=1 Tax=Immundisolibacter sp. TaxID=1934948 RepID=UPI0026033A61|nr:DUF2244 domain-containing protein [Immundisolibacter sp.]MDD3650254.1 DUF2244 domain-containing protein [Immundisolibacter sp.]